MANKILDIWYRIVAKSLLEIIDRQKYNYQTLLDEYINLNTELQSVRTSCDNHANTIKTLLERQEVENRDAAIAVQVIKERMQDMQLHPNVVSSGLHAAKQRNAELIRENTRLQFLLRRIQDGNH
jgi:hypothetical protein